MEIIRKYFPSLSQKQCDQFAQLEGLYREWNQKINVISRKDIDNLYAHHILHSLAIARFITFQADAHILDLGTGGGLPGIPLAIFFPETNFTLIDGTRKKIMVVQTISNELGLENCKAMHIRAEEHKGRYDFVVSRAVASIDKLAGWSFPLIKDKQQHAIPNGLITLKGGKLQQELQELPRKSYVEQYPLTDYFELPFYEEKHLIYVQA